MQEQHLESSGRSTTDIDIEIGKRLRAQRMACGISQEKLAGLVNLSFQQIQKYEKGTNRLSVSRLVEFSEILGVEPSFLIPATVVDARAEILCAVDEPIYAMLSTKVGRDILSAFLRLPSAVMKRKAADILVALADTAAEAQSQAA